MSNSRQFCMIAVKQGIRILMTRYLNIISLKQFFAHYTASVFSLVLRMYWLFGAECIY